MQKTAYHFLLNQLCWAEYKRYLSVLRVAVNKLRVEEIHWHQQEFNENRRNTGTWIYLRKVWFSYWVKNRKMPPTNLHCSFQRPVQQRMRPPKPLFVILTLRLEPEDDGRPWAWWALVKLVPRAQTVRLHSFDAFIIIININSTTASML